MKTDLRKRSDCRVLNYDRAGEPLQRPHPFHPGQANSIQRIFFCFCFLMDICDGIYYSLDTRHDLKHEYSKKPGSLQKNNETKTLQIHGRGRAFVTA